MKWFKHISDSLDDPFIFDVVSRFGGDGYMVFFGVLEIYAKNFQPDDGWKLVVSKRYLRSKLNPSGFAKKLRAMRYIGEKGGWDVSFDGDQISIFIKSFRADMFLPDIPYSSRQSVSGWASLRESVFHEDGHVCQYCGAQNVPLECDHIIPLSRGGSNEKSNLITACRQCNRAKSNKTLSEWMQ